MTGPTSIRLPGRSPDPPRVTHVEEVMGTAVVFDLQLESTAADERAAAVAAIGRAAEWLHWVDDTFTTYSADSVVSTLARGGLELAACPVEVRDVVAQCEQFRDRTAGWFDPWAGPTGFDPSGLVKGWSAQQASGLLRDDGFVRHCVNAGGDVAAAGRPADAPSWGVGIVDPFNRMRLLVVVAAVDCGVATSGTAERGLHVWRPVDGQPARDLASVTVVHDELVVADVFATAALAMGSGAQAWLEGEGLAALVVGADGSQWMSAGLRDRLVVEG
jgi:thiamine biosynthesis lipoprotein